MQAERARHGSNEEVESLRAQLAEAQQTIAAIRSGELDVLFGPDAPSTSHLLYTRSTAERIYRLIIERMQEGALTVSSDGIVLYCNPSFGRLVDGMPHAIVGALAEQWFVATGDVTLSALLRGRDSTSGDFDVITAGGGRVPASVSASSIVDDDSELRCLIVSDLRARRDVERLRQVRAELEIADQRKTEFIAMLGHELRNPLAPIRQAVEMLDAAARPGDSPQLRRARAVIARQVLHLTRLVDDLLDAGRIAKGTLMLRPAEIDLRDVVNTAVESVNRLVETRRHQFESVVPDRPLPIVGDPVRLTQVVANLLSNAAKYTPEGGSIRLELSLEPGAVQGAAHGAATITVRDTGQGITSEVLPHVFEPFVQAQTTIDRASGGLGVGLALVKRLVELHRGRVEATSAGLGKGAEFRVWLPLRSLSASTGDRPAEGTRGLRGHGGRRVLVVDDNEDAAEMLALVLRGRGHEVQVTFEGEDALGRAEVLRPDVVLLDIGLPGMDGYEVARRLRAGPLGRGPLLIALTGYGQDRDREASRAAGFDHHLIKPVDTDELERIIARGRASAGSPVAAAMHASSARSK